MFFLQLIPILLVCLTSSGHQQSSSQKTEHPYLVVEVRPRDDQSQFEFDGAHLFQIGKECVLQRLDETAPFKMSLDNTSYLIIRGKKGNGKIGVRYRVEKEEKRSFQYLGAGEAVVINFSPHGPAGTSWAEGTFDPRSWMRKVTFTVITKE